MLGILTKKRKTSSGFSDHVGVAEKYEIYLAAFGNPFYDLFLHLTSPSQFKIASIGKQTLTQRIGSSMQC